MKRLRFAAFLLLVFLIVLLSPSSSGQSLQTQTPSVSQSPPSQPDVSTGAPAASPGTTASSPSGSYRPRLKIRLVPPRNQPTSPKPLPDAPLIPEILGQRVADSSQDSGSQLDRGIFAKQRQRPDQLLDRGIFAKQQQRPDPQLDPGIRLKHHASNSCASIVSYNFSQGDNPELESVTTCTPADAVTTRRAQDKRKKPSAPLFQTTEYSAPRQ